MSRSNKRERYDKRRDTGENNYINDGDFSQETEVYDAEQTDLGYYDGQNFPGYEENYASEAELNQPEERQPLGYAPEAYEDEYVENYANISADEVYSLDRPKGRSERRSGENVSPVRIILWRLASPVLILAIAVAAVIAGVYFGGQMAFEEYFSPVASENSAQPVSVTINQGDSVTTISETLLEAGVIRNDTTFKYYADFTDKSMNFQPGTYTLTTDMTFDDIIEELSKTVYIRGTLMITIPEGYTVDDMGEYFEELGLFGGSSERFLELCRTGEGFEDYSFINDAINANNLSEEKFRYVLEGYLFPDTYEIYADASEETVIDKLLSRFRDIFNADMYTRAEELGMSMNEVVTLASMIEREAKPEDFARVSAVFHNRLEENMRFQSCATLQFYTGEDKYVFSEEEMAIDSLYNTYKYVGYPLGPISAPGKLALDAAVNPDEDAMEEGYFYFCLGDPATGETLFAKTLEEHEANTAEYERLWLEAQGEAEAESTEEDEDGEDADE